MPRDDCKLALCPMQDYAVDLVIRPGNMEPLDTFVAHNPAFSRELCVCVCVCVCV